MNCFYALFPPPDINHCLRATSFNIKRGEKAVCGMILGDFWGFMELGAEERAADLFHVLRLFLSAHPRSLCAAVPSDL
jgi:hypothetical protein